MAPAKKSPVAGHPDESMVAVAKTALLEITPLDTFVDQPVVSRADSIVTVGFPCTLPGYPGWTWTIAVNDIPKIDPTVIELELLPGEGALLPPDWVPWANRMEEYLLHEKEVHDAEALALDDDDDDEVDFDGDVDGLEIDELDLGLELDPAPLEVPLEPNDVFDHVEFDEPDPLDP